MFKDKLLELKSVPGLYEFVHENCFIAGGAVRDTLRKVTPKDYDIFFRTEESKDEFISKFTRTMTLTGIGNYNFKDFQFITLYTGNPDSVIKNFDWNVNQNYYEFGKTRPEFNFDQNDLRLNTDCEKPLAAYLRLPDMIKKGFTISKEELMFIIAFISARVNLQNTENLDKEFEWVSSGGGYIGAGAAKRAVERAVKDAKHVRHTKLHKSLK